MTDQNHHDEDTEPDYIAIMRETMEEWYSRPRSGWHVTDIALCPRQRIELVVQRVSIRQRM